MRYDIWRWCSVCNSQTPQTKLARAGMFTEWYCEICNQYRADQREVEQWWAKRRARGEKPLSEMMRDETD